MENFKRKVQTLGSLYVDLPNVKESSPNELGQIEFKDAALNKVYINECKKESEILLPQFEKLVSSRQQASKLDKNGMLEFPTDKRWLSGEEYAFLLRHYRAYSIMHPDSVRTCVKTHPNEVYDSPINGQIYFISGWHLREFGFPRKEELRKKFKWKKMNFTTDLPKNDPLCSYLVATGRVGKECYRMHVVVNSQEYSTKYRQSEILKQLRHDAKRTKSKLLAEDRATGLSERMILCHVLMRRHCPHQPPEELEFGADENQEMQGGRTRSRRGRSHSNRDPNAPPKKRGRPPKQDGLTVKERQRLARVQKAKSVAPPRTVTTRSLRQRDPNCFEEEKDMVLESDRSETSSDEDSVLQEEGEGKFTSPPVEIEQPDIAVQAIEALSGVDRDCILLMSDKDSVGCEQSESSDDVDDQSMTCKNEDRIHEILSPIASSRREPQLQLTRRLPELQMGDDLLVDSQSRQLQKIEPGVLNPEFAAHKSRRLPNNPNEQRKEENSLATPKSLKEKLAERAQRLNYDQVKIQEAEQIRDFSYYTPKRQKNDDASLEDSENFFLNDESYAHASTVFKLEDHQWQRVKRLMSSPQIVLSPLQGCNQMRMSTHLLQAPQFDVPADSTNQMFQEETGMQSKNISELVIETGAHRQSSLGVNQLLTTTLRSNSIKTKKVYHNQLRQEYDGVLPDTFLNHASEKQIDAFQLQLLACDLTHAQKYPDKYEKLLNYQGTIRAVKFRGAYYKFDPDYNVVEQLLSQSRCQSAQSQGKQAQLMEESSRMPHLTKEEKNEFSALCQDPMSCAAELLQNEANDQEMQRRRMVLNQSIERMLLDDDDDSTSYCCSFKQQQQHMLSFEPQKCHGCRQQTVDFEPEIPNNSLQKAFMRGEAML